MHVLTCGPASGPYVDLGQRKRAVCRRAASRRCGRSYALLCKVVVHEIGGLRVGDRVLRAVRGLPCTFRGLHQARALRPLAHLLAKPAYAVAVSRLTCDL